MKSFITTICWFSWLRWYYYENKLNIGVDLDMEALLLLPIFSWSSSMFPENIEVGNKNNMKYILLPFPILCQFEFVVANIPYCLMLFSSFLLKSICFVTLYLWLGPFYVLMLLLYIVNLWSLHSWLAYKSIHDAGSVCCCSISFLYDLKKKNPTPLTDFYFYFLKKKQR